MRYLPAIILFLIASPALAFTSSPSNSVIFGSSVDGRLLTCHPSDQKAECMAILDNFAFNGAVVVVSGDALVEGTYTVTNTVYDSGNARWQLYITPDPSGIYGVGEYSPSVFSTPVPPPQESIWGSGGVFGSTTPAQMLATVATGTTTSFQPLVALFALLGVGLAFAIAVRVQRFIMLSGQLRRTKDEYYKVLSETDLDDPRAVGKVQDKYNREITRLNRQLSGKSKRGKMGM